MIPASHEGATFFTQAELEARARSYAVADGNAEGITGEWLLFGVGRWRYALPMTSIDEVAEVGRGVALPHTPPYVLGLLSLRGDVVTLLDLGILLEVRGPVDVNMRQRVLILREDRPDRLGLLVDRIEGVRVLSPEVFRPLGGVEGTGSPWIEAVAELPDGPLLRPRVEGFAEAPTRG